ncbi:TPA: AAA family ATPase [Acinetobacter nosocomialis]|nr:AAA family ATPase [Acinetobacter nosocomialis]
MIKEFYINGLHNERDVNISFNSECKIIVAENGYGKTSILNAFYALMFSDIDKLRKISFNSLGVKFTNGDEYSFNKKDFNLDVNALSKNGMGDIR